jgi:hypothetical protein
MEDCPLMVKRGDRVRFRFVEKDYHLVVHQMEWQK